MGLTEFFTMEAGDYLDRLDGLVSRAGPLDAEELLRLTRALRGSALMANQQAIAGAAAAFEALARAVREQRRPWDEGTRQLAIRAVDDFKILVRAAADWNDAAEARARGITAELEHAAGRAAPGPARAAQGLDAGTRAFLGREGAAVASALHEGARSLQQSPRGREPFDRVLRVMQPLRGLAILSEIPPLADLLEGIEQAIAELTRRRERTEGADLLFEAGARAIARAAREIAASGRADAESPETRDFTRRLATILELHADAVPIESLYYDDAGPHIVQHGTPVARPARLGRLELVSHGEHLKLAADELERAQSATQRELRAQTLAGTFRALAALSGGRLEDAVSHFGHAAREAVARGVAVRRTATFAGQLREAGTALSECAEGDEDDIVRRVEDVTRRCRETPAAPPVEEMALAGGPPRRPPAESAAFAVPAAPATLAAPAARAASPVSPSAAAPPAAPAPVREPAPAGEPEDLVGSWTRYEHFLTTLGLGTPSIEDLLAGPPAERLAGDGAVAAAEVVPIASLCYSGRAALDRALALREQVRGALTGDAPDLASVQELVQEVFDLVELGRGHGGA
jgi:chemotaxis protein histidine kinase CheA